MPNYCLTQAFLSIKKSVHLYDSWRSNDGVIFHCIRSFRSSLVKFARKIKYCTIHFMACWPPMLVSINIYILTVKNIC